MKKRIQIRVLQLVLGWIERTLTKERGEKVVIAVFVPKKVNGHKLNRRMWYLRKLLDVSGA